MGKHRFIPWQRHFCVLCNRYQSGKGTPHVGDPMYTPRHYSEELSREYL